MAVRGPLRLAVIHSIAMILVSSLAVRRRTISIFFILALSCVSGLLASQQPVQTPSGATATPPPAQQPTQQTSPQAPAQPPAQSLPQPSGLATVVVDPGHGGIDPGAHGSSGIIESDVVLGFARLLRISLEAQGLRVILTRQANEDPSFDERSQKVNAQRGAIFITLHVSSTGPAGTVRVYSLPMDSTPAATEPSHPPRSRLVSWDHAQQAYLGPSRKLAELVQAGMAQRFPASPALPATAAVRQLRTVSAPAIAIELSSVSLPDRAPLDQMGPGLADGVARAVAAFRPPSETARKENPWRVRSK